MVVQKPTKKAASPSKKKASPAKSGSSSSGSIPASTKDLTAAHWRDLNKAVTQLSAKNAKAICEMCPSLTPWKPKGVLISLVRQLMRAAPEGVAAAKLIEEEEKASKKDGEGAAKDGA